MFICYRIQFQMAFKERTLETGNSTCGFYLLSWMYISLPTWVTALANMLPIYFLVHLNDLKAEWDKDDMESSYG